MTPEKLKEIRDGNKIVAVAGKLGLLKRPINENTQTSYNIHCPNVNKHSKGDHAPSLALLPKINRFKCYGPSCGESGDVFSLVQLTLGISLPEAIKWLDPNAELYPTSHQEAKKYLNEKGLSLETLSKFKVYVGDTWDNGEQYECVYFPIGKEDGLKYRLFGAECKYKNKTGTKNCLFKTIDDPPNDLVVLCEGELDAMAGWQNTGYPFWTSTGGAGTFNKDWVDEFKRFNQIIIGFDNDEAGKIGATNTIKILTDGGVSQNKIIQIEVPELFNDCKDWCDYFGKYGFKKEDFDGSINSAVLAKRGVG